MRGNQRLAKTNSGREFFYGCRSEGTLWKRREAGKWSFFELVTQTPNELRKGACSLEGQKWESYLNSKVYWIIRMTQRHVTVLEWMQSIWKHWPFNLWPRKHNISSHNPAPILVILSYCQCRMHKEKLLYWKWFHTHLKKYVTLSHNILDYTCLCFKIQQLVWFSHLPSKQTSKKPIIFFSE